MNSKYIRIILFFLTPFLFGFSTEEVNFIDPLGYTKPQYYPVTLPDEGTANKYYVDLNAAGGGDGTQGTPWQDIESVDGNITAPAYIYVATGDYDCAYLYNISLSGSEGNEIVIVPSGGLVRFSSDSTHATVVQGANVHNVIIDGGADLDIEFYVCDPNHVKYALTIRADDITVRRCRFRAGECKGILVDVGSFVTVDNVNFYNCEFYDSNSNQGTQQNMYWGPGDPSTITNCSVKNCIFRDLGGEGIELNIRTLMSNMVISGNIFHNIGKQTCYDTFACRPAITVSRIAVDDIVQDVYIYNNIMWDLGASGIYARAGEDRLYIYDNTIYDYANNPEGSPYPGDQEGVSDYGTPDSTAWVVNNIIYDPDGTAAFDSGPYNKLTNLTTNPPFISVDPTSGDFLKIGTNSAAYNTGTDVYSDGSLPVTTDFEGDTITVRNDIGADEYTAVETPEESGISVTIVKSETGASLVKSETGTTILKAE